MDNMGSKSVTNNFIWSFGERILAQGVSFIVSIVLARILLPDDYGIISLVLVFINIANVFVSSGLGESLIQKKGSDILDFSTIFWCSCIISWILYIAIFACAPLISSFYKNALLTPVLRVISLKIPLASINTVQHAYVSKKMQFRKFFFSTLIGTLVSGGVGIWMALKGFGVWSLVAQYLVNSTMDTIILLITVDWKPKFIFSVDRAKNLLGFGGKMIVSELINTTYIEMQSLAIGAKYSTDDLAYFKRGNQFPSLFISNACIAAGKVLFPTLSNADTVENIKRMTRRSLSIMAYIVLPLMFGLIAIAQPMVKIILTEKWLKCVPFLQLACIQYMFQPFQTANCQAIKALGRSDIYIKMEIVKKTFGIIALLIAINISVFAVAISCALSIAFSAFISMIPNIKLMKYSFAEQITDVGKSFLMSLVMLGVIYPIILLDIPTICILMLQITIAVVIYIFLSKVFHVESFQYLIALLKSFRK